MVFRTRLESAIQREILSWLSTVDCLFSFKTVATNRRGIPDIAIVYNGVAIFFEVKQPGRKPRIMQEYQGSQISKAGGHFYVVTSLDEAKKALANHQ